MTPLIFVFVAGGVILVALSIPMLLRRVKPNYWYGFRTRKTLANVQVWYDVNAYAGKRLLVSGILITAAAILFAFVPEMSVDAYAWWMLAVVVVTLGISLASSFRYLNQR